MELLSCVPVASPYTRDGQLTSFQDNHDYFVSINRHHPIFINYC